MTAEQDAAVLAEIESCSYGFNSDTKSMHIWVLLRLLREAQDELNAAKRRAVTLETLYQQRGKAIANLNAIADAAQQYIDDLSTDSTRNQEWGFTEKLREALSRIPASEGEKE